MERFFQDRPGYLARADLQKCSGSHKSRFAFICHCFCLGYFASCVSDSVSTDDGDEKSWGTKITWFSR
ncbi:Uncharacterised protein [Streptococcus pneumoniae]|nr:Uncharacterised protein [Streptococcus pneumoniae]